jgi:phage terminase large subunit-like protein
MQPDSPDAIVLQAMEKATIGRRARAKWLATARPEQLPPAWAWHTWLMLAGRGFGKTRSGSEHVSHVAAMHSDARIGLVGATAADVRDIMVEGAAGILAVSPSDRRPLYEPSKRRLTWPNGAVASLYSAEEPERLRGPEHSFVWADELGAWQNQQETWDQIQFGLRIGANPQILVTTTPRPTKLIKALAASKTTALVRGSTFDNAANLAPSALEKFKERYGGTRLGRQELDGELLEDVQGALWTRAMIEAARLDAPPPAMRRVVVSVDPSGSDGSSGDAQGIVVAGLGVDGRGYVLADATMRGSPDEWATVVAALYRDHRADRVVAEKNYGGAMVEAVLRTAAPNLPVTLVSATRGKAVRAEPVSALYEQRKISHVEPFAEMEDELVLMTGGGYAGSGSPNRLDAMVWAFTDLMLEDGEESTYDMLRIFMLMNDSSPEEAHQIAMQGAEADALAKAQMARRA